MADSTVFSKSTDVSKLKVIELKKELKIRGLSTSGDKSELTSRLQAALSKDNLGDDALDSDELDSDGVLEDDDDDDKVDHDLIMDDIISNESEVTGSSKTLTTKNVVSSADTAVSSNTVTPTTPRVLKRRAPPTISLEEKLLSPDSKTPEDPSPAKKIVLNRTAITAPTASEPPTTKANDVKTDEASTEDKPKVIKLTMDPQSRLEMRAKRFGLPPTEDAMKEARKARFGGSSAPTTGASSQKISAAPSASLDILKKRAERFGASVSKVVVEAENKEKLEKRKAKFNLIKI